MCSTYQLNRSFHEDNPTINPSMLSKNRRYSSFVADVKKWVKSCNKENLTSIDTELAQRVAMALHDSGIQKSRYLEALNDFDGVEAICKMIKLVQEGEMEKESKSRKRKNDRRSSSGSVSGSVATKVFLLVSQMKSCSIDTKKQFLESGIINVGTPYIMYPKKSSITYQNLILSIFSSLSSNFYDDAEEESRKVNESFMKHYDAYLDWANTNHDRMGAHKLLYNLAYHRCNQSAMIQSKTLDYLWGRIKTIQESVDDDTHSIGKHSKSTSSDKSNQFNTEYIRITAVISMVLLIGSTYDMNQEGVQSHTYLRNVQLPDYCITIVNESLECTIAGRPLMLDKTANGRNARGSKIMFDLEKILMAMSKLCSNDTLKRSIVDEGGIEVILNVLLNGGQKNISTSNRAKAKALECLWSLAYNDIGRFEIKTSYLNFIEEFTTLEEKDEESSNHGYNNKDDDVEITTNAAGCIVTVTKAMFDGGDRVTDTLARVKKFGAYRILPRIKLSYHLADKEKVLRIHRALAHLGIDVTIDIESSGYDMEKNPIDRAAHAIENCDLVMIFPSQTFMESPMCRLEVEFANALKRDVVPILMSNGDFHPFDWLRILLSRRSLQHDPWSLSWDKQGGSFINEINLMMRSLIGSRAESDTSDSTIASSSYSSSARERLSFKSKKKERKMKKTPSTASAYSSVNLTKEIKQMLKRELRRELKYELLEELRESIEENSRQSFEIKEISNIFTPHSKRAHDMISSSRKSNMDSSFSLFTA